MGTGSGIEGAKTSVLVSFAAIMPCNKPSSHNQRSGISRLTAILGPGLRVRYAPRVSSSSWASCYWRHALSEEQKVPL